MFGLLLFFFFFQAEDGIRDADVTGVQTCALPISVNPIAYGNDVVDQTGTGLIDDIVTVCDWVNRADHISVLIITGAGSAFSARSEERRVGKECRSRWSPEH